VRVAAIVNADNDPDVLVARTTAGLDKQIAQWCRDSWDCLKWHAEPDYPETDTDEAMADQLRAVGQGVAERLNFDAFDAEQG
jgi:hypothetical protein